MKRSFRLLTAFICLVAIAPAQRTPQLSLSDNRVTRGDFIEVHGVGFTPMRYALSHLKKPDGTEYGVRRFLTNDHGEYFQRLDTTMLDIGRHELWAVDGDSRAVSGIVSFEVK